MKLQNISLMFALLFSVSCSSIIQAGEGTDEKDAAASTGTTLRQRKVEGQSGRSRSGTVAEADVTTEDDVTRISDSEVDRDGKKDKSRLAVTLSMFSKTFSAIAKKHGLRKPTRKEAGVCFAFCGLLWAGATTEAWTNLVETSDFWYILAALDYVAHLPQVAVCGASSLAATLCATLMDNAIVNAAGEWIFSPVTSFIGDHGGNWLMENALSPAGQFVADHGGSATADGFAAAWAAVANFFPCPA